MDIETLTGRRTYQIEDELMSLMLIINEMDKDDSVDLSMSGDIENSKLFVSQIDDSHSHEAIVVFESSNSLVIAMYVIVAIIFCIVVALAIYLLGCRKPKKRGDYNGSEII